MKLNTRSFRKGGHKSMLLLGVASALLSPAAAVAAPQGGTIKAGTATITTPTGTSTVINQQSSSAIINWNSFGIAANEQVRFIQPGQTSVALNRVTGTDPSIILGSLTANGRVFLINTNGIVFGAGSQVDVGGLLASTMTMSDSDFLAGNYNLTQGTGPLTSVVNQGTLKAADGGYLVLAAPLVSNQGTMVANLGKVTLFAGKQASISFDGGLLSFTTNPAAPGDVIVSPQALNGILQQSVNNQEVVAAGSVVAQADGTYRLTGSEGLVVNSGTIQANGGARHNAGTITLIGTQSVDLTSGSETAANGVGTRSNAGTIHVWAQSAAVLEGGARMDATAGWTGQFGNIDLCAGNMVDLSGSAHAANFIVDGGMVGTYTTVIPGL